LDENSILLESSRSIGSGQRIKLDVSSLKEKVETIFYPGQVVMIEGVNSDGKTFYVENVIKSDLNKTENIEACCDEDLCIITASGPFSSLNLDYSPFIDLLKVSISYQPDLLILVIKSKIFI
jgi:DNA polymerase alpha subunit B